MEKLVSEYKLDPFSSEFESFFRGFKNPEYFLNTR